MDSKEFEQRLQFVEDTLQIDRLEKIYGYYLDNGQILFVPPHESEKRVSFVTPMISIFSSVRIGEMMPRF